MKLIDKNGIILQDGDKVTYEGDIYEVRYTEMFGHEIWKIMRATGGYWITANNKPHEDIEKVA